MLKFIPDEIPSKRFFSQASGYTDWNQLNKDYQVITIMILVTVNHLMNN